jgi:uncharacterized protein
MIIISDTSCMSALVRIGHLDLLHQIFNQIVIPKKVYDELLRLKDWGIDPTEFDQAWIHVLEPHPTPLLSTLLTEIDEGEAYAIVLGIELAATVFLTDDMLARKYAEQHFTVIGVGGILIRAKKLGFIAKVKPLLDQILNSTTFRMSPKVYTLILSLADE